MAPHDDSVPVTSNGDEPESVDTGETAEASPVEPTPDEAAAARLAAHSFQGTHIGVVPLGQPAPAMSTPDLTSDVPSTSVVARCAEANTQARTRSIEHVAKWFPGYDFDAASQTTDDRRFTVLDIGAELHEHLGALETVERIVAQHDLVGRQITFSHGVHKNKEPDRIFDLHRPNVRRLNVGALVDALENQWTAILNNIDAIDPAIAGVLEHLERIYGCPINTNVYLSSGEAIGFGPHWDNHDTIIVPALGAKKWTVYEPSILSPLRPWATDEVSPRPVWEGTIEPGMCLVIPRGWGHEVGGSDGLSIHYTIGVNRLMAQSVLERLILDAGYNHLLRADLAYDPDGETHSYEGSIHDEDALASAVTEIADGDLVKRAISTFRGRMRMRLFPRLFDTWSTAGSNDWTGAVLRMPVPAGVQVLGVAPERALLAFGDFRVDVSPAAFDIFAMLCDTEPHAFEDLPAGEGDDDIRAEVCRELVLGRLVDVHFAT